MAFHPHGKLLRMRISLSNDVTLSLEKFYSSSQFDFSNGQYSGEGVMVRLYRIGRQWWGNRRREEYHQIN